MKKKTAKSKQAISKLLGFNKYLLAGIFFLVWVVFLDSHSVIKQRSLDKTINNLNNEIVEMEKKYKQELQTQLDLQKNPERYARDNYFMHKENETVFVINKEESN